MVRKLRVIGFGVVIFAGVAACGDDDGLPPGPEAAPAEVKATELSGVPFPADNPPNADKIALGRMLYWDPILSGDKDVACASCHDPAFGYSDGRGTSIGTGGKVAPRAALSVLDAAWNGWTALSPKPSAADAPMFWDNRAHSLEEQARGPITGEGEMRGTAFSPTTIFPELVARLNAIPQYVTQFHAAFGADAAIDETSIVRAIATFERTLVSVPSYERWLAGDANVISAQAQRGVQTFRRIGCSRCHSGPMLSDFQLHKFRRNGEAVRTPSLRNVTRTAPYMHDGRAANLNAVFDIYRRVDDDADPNFRALRVPGGGGGGRDGDRGDDGDRDGDRADVVAFLQAASDGDFDRSVPSSVPSGLPVGGRRVADVVATSR